MIKRLEEFNKTISIVGFDNVRIKDTDSFLNLIRSKVKNAIVQFFDAKLVANWKHLYFAALNALTAFKNKINISNNLALETLLYASAQRQIKNAVKLIGVKPKTSQVAVLIIAETQEEANTVLENVSKLIPGKRNDNALDLTEEKIHMIKRLFDISDAEFEAKLEREGLEKQALVDLVIEHMALLATQR